MDSYFLPVLQLKKWKTRPILLEKLFGIRGQELECNILEANSTNERIQLIEEYLLQDSKTINAIVNSTVTPYLWQIA